MAAALAGHGARVTAAALAAAEPRATHELDQAEVIGPEVLHLGDAPD